MGRAVPWTGMDLAATLLPLLAMACAPQPLAPGAAERSAAEAAPAAVLPAGAGGDWWGRAQQQLAEREYGASESGAGLQAPNRAHNLRTWFEVSGIRVHDRTAAGSPELVRLALAGVGRGEALAAVEPGETVAQQRRVEIRRPGLVEWYVNSREGLEQGFTLAERPAGAGPLVLELAVAGAQASLVGEAVVLTTEPGRRLRYGKLAASDAAGRALAARLEVPAAGRVRLVVEDAGAAYPLAIDPLLTGIDDTQLSGDQAGTLLGCSVAGAGDVNGDGYADVIVGAYGYDAGQTQEGAAFVFLGSVSGIADGTPAAAAAQLESDQADAWLGSSVAGAGDVNGDGYADVIVGASRYDNGQADEGAAFVFLGSASGIADGNPSTAAAQLESNQSGATYTLSSGNVMGVAGAGDANGDGYADVIVGAALYDWVPLGLSDVGVALVFHGSSSGIADGNPSTANTILLASCGSCSSFFARSVAGAGDVNGDGFADVIVGAPLYDVGQTDEGVAFVHLGSASGIPSGNSYSARLESNQASAHLGDSVASAGDVNGDGYADVIVGASLYDSGQADEGAAFVFLGGAAGVANGSPATAAQLESDQTGAQLGDSVSGAGDANGDGYADVIVGARFYSNGESLEGAAFVFLGGWSGIESGGPAEAAAQLEGGQLSAVLGSSVAGAGDVNGDGYADVIVGAPLRNNSGSAFVYLGSAEAIADAFPATAGTLIEGNVNGAELGFSVAGAGDTNGDGYADVLVGAPYFDSGQTDEGSAFLFLGSATGIADASPASAFAQLQSDQGSAWFGWSVAGAGDVNGDGYADVLVGGIQYDNGQAEEGAAFVFLGAPSGILNGNPLTAAAQLESNQASADLGTSVAGAGDVNGDGYADVIVGAYHYDNGQSNEGAAFVFLGSGSGIADGSPATAAAQLESSQADAGLGWSVSGAGDVNGDGYADVLVGAPYFDNGQADEGASFVFPGSAAGIAHGTPATAATQLESDQIGASFGASVAGAGDVNGDGYADVLVGAWSYDAGQSNEGAAFVFQGSATGIADGSPVTAAAQLESNQASALLGNSVAGAGDVNGDGYADVIVGAHFYEVPFATDEGAAFVFVGSASGVADGNPATAAAEMRGNQVSAWLGWSVAGLGDVNGDGYADVIVGARLFDAGHLNEGAAFVFLGNGDGDGRLVRARQLRSSVDTPIQPWGRSYSKHVFRVRMQATHPAGRGRVKLRVEYCPPGVPFGHASCGSKVGASWTDVTATSGGVAFTETIGGLVNNTNYRWRARVLHALYTVTQAGITAPPKPAHGPWRRLQAQAVEADLRTRKSGGSCGLGFELALLLPILLPALLRRRRST